MKDISQHEGRARPGPEEPSVTLASGDERLAEVVGSVAASIGVALHAVSTRADVVAAWEAPGPLLVGQDRASAAVAWQLPVRQGIHVVGQDAEQASRWSAALGASVIVVPQGNATLAELLRDGIQEAGRGTVMLIDQAGGGMGASTLAAGVAADAAAAGLPTALVELDPGGGGMDLLLGAERVEGWRWPELASARGTVRELAQHLPALDAVTVVSAGREPCQVGQAARAAVVASLAADHDLVVLDRGHLPGEAVAGMTVDRRVMVIGADLRSLMSARALGMSGATPVLRHGPGHRMSAPDAAAIVGAEPLLVVPHDHRLPRAADVGEAPWVMAGRRWRRACRDLREAVIPDE
ncbi:septum site-determining protein Ssd [Acidipropionibacterium acidipropionici]|uniref:septum site-determining protein Ssd n=1 Tax=Acidipropionibacterium acidipropionici TaxID=1748 RepID=UPI0003F83900|nr:septum site-determining protein Ssd [Acidipropionibacterium acidipropionici]ALN15151.1 pilus assembly protein CpaE [Acidipropionibacterium acidipropionici]APZ09096.1 pilus assembly protein CpaE [Acidipropionibacterium acidipropionici]